MWSLVARFLAAIIAFIGGPIPVQSLHPAVRVGDATTQVGTQPAPTTTTIPLPLPLTPVITDYTGQALAYLSESYTPAELAVGGDVTIVVSSNTGGIAVVPYRANQFPECAGAITCIMVAPEWLNRGDYARVIIDHEWAHVLVLRRTQYLSGTDAAAAWIDSVNRVNEECLADAVASNVLARGWFAPNETPEYVAHYECEAYWADRYGTSLADETAALAADLLGWAA